MALPAAAVSCLLLSLLIAVTPVPCTCEERPRMAGNLIQCYDDQTPALSNATKDGTESFRASLLSLLAALPSAAAPTGFASLSSTGGAFVRGLCFGDATVPPSECLACLSVAASHLSASCGTTARRAGIWTDRCFVAYADTTASSPAEDAFRSRVLLRGDDADAENNAQSSYPHAGLVSLAQRAAQSAAANISGARMLATADAATILESRMLAIVKSTVHVLAQCARDRTAAECVRCLQESARAVDWDVDADRRDGGVAAAVVAFNCYLRFEVVTALVPQKAYLVPLIIVGVLVGILLALGLCVLLLRCMHCE